MGHCFVRVYDELLFQDGINHVKGIFYSEIFSGDPSLSLRMTVIKRDVSTRRFKS